MRNDISDEQARQKADRIAIVLLMLIVLAIGSYCLLVPLR
jgi:hypothetical protein